jgi:predicted metal-dependent phosphoesterase TrpH
VSVTAFPEAGPDSKIADLHLHTRYSDGTFTPEELAENARREGLSAIALTDHDTVDGCAEAADACRARGIEFIPGAEITAEIGGQEVHVLAYWIDTQSALLQQRFAEFQSIRTGRIHGMVRQLNERGVALTAESVFEIAQCKAPGRPHVARALVSGGFCSDFDDAFERYLKKGRPGWVPKPMVPASAAVELIHACGGVAVLAHPALYRADRLVTEAARAGIDGVECWHTKHNPEASRRYQKFAQDLNLVATGGSDCHGNSKGQPLIGRIRLPYAQVEQLRARRPVVAAASATAAALAPTAAAPVTA